MVVGISSWRVSATCWRSWVLSSLIRRVRNWRIWSPARHAPNLHVGACVPVLDNADDTRGYQRMWDIDSQWLDSFKNVLEKNPSASSTNWLCGEVNPSVEEWLKHLQVGEETYSQDWRGWDTFLDSKSSRQYCSPKTVELCYIRELKNMSLYSSWLFCLLDFDRWRVLESVRQTWLSTYTASMTELIAE